jgi:hypothetical protein
MHVSTDSKRVGGEKKESGKEERCLDERTGGKGEVEAICGGMVGLLWESADRGG